MTTISEKHKVVVFDKADAAHVSMVIPSAREVELGGKPRIVVPHGLVETKVLRNLGFDIPNPVRHYYSWPGEYKPFFAQTETVDFLTMNQRAFCLNQMGTGKTAATLWAYDYLKSEKMVERMLVITPLSTLERTWGDEIFRNFMSRRFAVLHGTRKQRLDMLADKQYDIYLINHDGIKTPGFVDALKDRTDINLVVVDEVATFRNSGSERWKCLNTICNKQVPRAVWGLTGTPIPNEPTDAWAQCRIINPGNVPPYFSKFRDATMKQISTYKWMARDGALEIVKEAMQPSILYTRADCMDLPPVIFETRTVELSPEQGKAYRDMMLKFHTEFAGGEIVARNEAIKLNKLLQICCGVAYDDAHETVSFPTTARINVVKEIVEEAGGKVIVFVPFTAALNQVADALSEEWDTAIIHGGTSKKNRDETFRAFQSEASPKIIVAQPGTMSHGLTLTAANTIVWFAPIHSNEIFNQAIARITRPGQKLNQLIVMIEGSEVERRVYARLRKRTRTQGILLDMLKETQ